MPGTAGAITSKITCLMLVQMFYIASREKVASGMLVIVNHGNSD